MFILLINSEGKEYLVKKSDIRRVEGFGTTLSKVYFNNKLLNTPITVDRTPSELLSFLRMK